MDEQQLKPSTQVEGSHPLSERRLWRHPTRRKTGPKPGFDREQVVDAALAIGIAQFRMSDVAKHLGVVSSALYREFPSRDAIVDACLARAATTMVPSSAELSWQDQLREYARSTWKLAEQFPGIADVIIQVPGAHVHIQPQLQVMSANLVAAGIPGGVEKAHFALNFLGDSVLHLHTLAMRTCSISEDGDSWIKQAEARFAQAGLGDDAVYAPNESWAVMRMNEQRVETIIRGLE